MIVIYTLGDLNERGRGLVLSGEPLVTFAPSLHLAERNSEEYKRADAVLLVTPPPDGKGILTKCRWPLQEGLLRRVFYLWEIEIVLLALIEAEGKARLSA